MGGARRHHYVPDFLLRRFAVRGAGRDSIVRGLVRGRVCEVNTKKVGVISLFHQCSGLPQDAEAVLSGYEDDFARETSAWRPGPLDRDGADAARELVRHLRTRSPRIRALVRHVAGCVGEVMEQCVREAMPETPPPRSLSDELLSLWDGTTTPDGQDLEAMKSRLASIVPEVVGRHVRWAIIKGLREFVTATRLLDIVGQSHTLVVIQGLCRAAETDALHELEWEVIGVPTDELLIGDGAPVARYRGEAGFFELFQRDQPLELTALPVAPGALLIGRRPGAAMPSVESVNAAMIGLSQEFVVGRWPAASFESSRERFGASVDGSPMQRVLGSELEPMRREMRAALVEMSKRLDAFLAGAMGVSPLDRRPSSPALAVVTPTPGPPLAPAVARPQG